MTKPIEWTTKRPDEVTQRRGLIVEVREEQDQPRPGGWHIVDQKRATPADLVAALAAMGEAERGEVLERFVNYYGEPVEHLRAEKDRAWRAVSEARKEQSLAEGAEEKARREAQEANARAEKAERERDRMAAEFGCCPGEIPDDGEIARVVRERAEFRDRAEKAERERDKAVALQDVAVNRLAVLERERDAARLELRALEWLHEQYDEDYPHDWFYRGSVVWTMSADGEETEHATYASAALALGWEGRGDG